MTKKFWLRLSEIMKSMTIVKSNATSPTAITQRMITTVLSYYTMLKHYKIISLPLLQEMNTNVFG